MKAVSQKEKMPMADFRGRKENAKFHQNYDHNLIQILSAWAVQRKRKHLVTHM